MKRFLIKEKYRDLAAETAIEIGNKKYVRVVLEDYPTDDWYSHPYSGNTSFEEWQLCTYLPLSENERVLLFPDDDDNVLKWYNIDSLVINGERVWAGDALIPLVQ
jgi:hypothetical protein